MPIRRWAPIIADDLLYDGDLPDPRSIRYVALTSPLDAYPPHYELQFALTYRDAARAHPAPFTMEIADLLGVVPAEVEDGSETTATAPHTWLARQVSRSTNAGLGGFSHATINLARIDIGTVAVRVAGGNSPDRLRIRVSPR